MAERTAAGDLRVFAITTSDCDGLKGVISLIDVDDNSAEVGYWVGVPYWGQGLASSALLQLCNFARESLGLETLRAQVLLRNPASARVLERCGFQCIRQATSRCGYRRQDEATANYLRTL